MKSPPPHIKLNIPYNDWFYNHSQNYENGNYWTNLYRLDYSVPSYLFRYDNYVKGLKNSHVLKSTFGNKSKQDIQKEITYWFNRCIGAYSTVDIH